MPQPTFEFDLKDTDRESSNEMLAEYALTAIASAMSLTLSEIVCVPSPVELAASSRVLNRSSKSQARRCTLQEREYQLCDRYIHPLTTWALA